MKRSRASSRRGASSMTRPMFRVCPLHAKHAEVRVAKTLAKAIRLAEEMAHRRDEQIALFDPSGKLLQTFI